MQKVALVTGGTKGIGKAIADQLSDAGIKVIVTARNQPEETSKHQFIAADLTKPADVERLAAEVGTIDILIDNIGGLTTPGGGYSTLTDEHWESELQLNLLAAIRLDRAMIPKMKSGVIIHISSIAGRAGLWYLNMAYAVSKAALDSYSKILSTELAPKGIRVLTVSPGGVRTEPMLKVIKDFADNAGIPVEEGEKELIKQIGGIPMGRMAEPEEVASLVSFLVSPGAAYLTGTIYSIDGGAIPVI